MAADTSNLNMLAEKVVQPAINPKHLEYCPTMDLIAFASIDEQVHIHRLNGQRVFGVSGKQSTGKVSSIKWKPNGQLIAVAFQNNVLQLTNAHTGKVIHHIDCKKHSKSPVCSLGWSINSTSNRRVDLPNVRLGPEISLDELLGQGKKGDSHEQTPDLPSDLAFLDVEAMLPQLSPLALGESENDLFSSRSSLDAIFQSPDASTNEAADVLLVGFEDGTLHLSIYDFFEIGSFNLRMASSALQNSKLLYSCAHPFSTTHAMLVADESATEADIHFVPLDLRLINNTGRYLSLLASKSTQLHNILRYIQQVQRQMYTEFRSSQDLPRRFMQNIEEPLHETLGCTWIQAAYHLVVTGNCYPQVKEWMVDELGERVGGRFIDEGHKRWDKAVTAGYVNVLQLAFENLLPALERSTVLVSRLRGLSKFQDSKAALGLATQELDNVLDTTACMQLFAHHVLIAARVERRGFTAFSAWLKHEIDTQSLEPGSTAAQEACERDHAIDHASTLEYIQGAMKQSRLATLFNMGFQADERKQWDISAEGGSLYEMYKRELKTVYDPTASEKQLPGLDALIGHLDSQCNAVFARIAATQSRNVRIGNPVSLGRYLQRRIDMRMLAENEENSNSYTVYIALIPRAENNRARILRVTLTVENGMSNTESVEYADLLPSLGKVQDIKFIDDQNVMVAVVGKSSSHLVEIQYRKFDNREGLDYATYDSDEKIMTESSPNTTVIDPQQPHPLRRLSFPQGPTWTPERIEVNGRKGKRAICVLAQDSLHYRIYDLDSTTSDEETMEIVDD